MAVVLERGGGRRAFLVCATAHTGTRLPYLHEGAAEAPSPCALQHPSEADMPPPSPA